MLTFPWMSWKFYFVFDILFDLGSKNFGLFGLVHTPLSYYSVILVTYFLKEPAHLSCLPGVPCCWLHPCHFFSFALFLLFLARSWLLESSSEPAGCNMLWGRFSVLRGGISGHKPTAGQQEIPSCPDSSPEDTGSPEPCGSIRRDWKCGCTKGRPEASF